MAVSFKKNRTSGGASPQTGLEFISVKLEWEERDRFGYEFDLDLSCFLLDKNRKLIREKDFVFYNNPVSSCQSVVYKGDNQTGDCAEEDEVIEIDLPKAPAEIQFILLAASIYDCVLREQIFGKIPNAHASIINRKTGKKIASYDLSEAYRDESIAVICEFYRHNGQWKFRNINESSYRDLPDMAQAYGIEPI